MKWSQYNYFFKAEDKYFLYNSLSNSFAELESNIYQELINLKNNHCTEISDIELRDQLLSMKAFVEDDRDEINKIKYITHKRRFDNRHLGLTINPTLHCNFACPYCFEGNHPNIYMTDQVEDDIIKYIKAHNNAKSIHITWFGGEPLLAFDRIVSLTTRIKELKLNYKAGMITNGYLFNESIASQLSDLDIKNIQITIDGDEKSHDSRRYLKSGKGTFQKIVDNISLLEKVAPKVRVTIRVNIDDTNKNDFIEVFNYFKEKFSQKIIVAPGFVEDTSGCNVDDCIFNAERKTQFIVRMQKEYGLNFSYFYPSSHRYECSVRNPNTISIGPSGEIYKCWNDIGNKDRITGYLNGKIENENLLMRYLNGADPFDDDKCKECLLLPVCGGGCPYMRLKKEYEGKDVELCSLLKDNLNDFLLIHYHNTIKD